MFAGYCAERLLLQLHAQTNVQTLIPLRAVSGYLLFVGVVVAFGVNHHAVEHPLHFDLYFIKQLVKLARLNEL